MTLVVLHEAPGTSASTTSSLALAALAPQGQQTLVLECDASGGDLIGWADLTGNPSWSSAVSGADRSWAGMLRHLQRLPSGLHVMAAPTNASRARTVVAEAAERFAPMVSSLSDVVAFADCGRTTESNGWLRSADLVVVLLRQSASVGATVARVDRTTEIVASLGSSRSGLVVVGERPVSTHRHRGGHRLRVVRRPGRRPHRRRPRLRCVDCRTWRDADRSRTLCRGAVA